MLSYDFLKEFFDNSPVLDNKYKILQNIGEGRYAKVKLAINLEDRKKYAIKIMREDQVNTASKLENFLNEVQILSSVHYSHIVQIVSVSINGQYKKPNGKISQAVYYVMKYAEYGELFEILQQTTSFSERIARYYFHQLLESIEHLHNSGIGHRDVKTENVLIDHNFNLKLADFGCACTTRTHTLARIGFNNQMPVGSPEYNAPEITNNSVAAEYYAESADIFSAGSTLFVMVLQSIPFNSSLYNDPYYSRLCKKDTSKFWKIFDSSNTLTPEFKDLIEKMMESNPQKRINIDEIKKHEWFRGPLASYEEVSAEMRKRGETILALNQEKIREYHNKKMRKVTHTESESRGSIEFGLEDLRQMMLPTIEEINHKLRREAEEREIYDQMKLTKSESSFEKPKLPGRRRSSDLKLSKEDLPSAKPKGQYGMDHKDAKLFLNETCMTGESEKMAHRQFAGLKKNSPKEERIRVRRSGSDD